MNRICDDPANIARIFDSLPDLVLVIGLDLRVRFANEAALRLAGRVGEDASGLFCHEFFHRRDKPCDSYDEYCPIREIIEKDRPVKATRRLFDRLAAEGLYEITAAPLTDGTGRLTGFVEILRKLAGESSAAEQATRPDDDLPARHEKLQQLFDLVANAKREWEAAMDCVSDLVVLVDVDGNVKRCNRAFAEYSGKPFQELLGEDFYRLLEERGMRGHSPALADGEEELHCRRSGLIYQKQVHSLAAGQVVAGRVITLHDITEQKRITRELEESNKEIGRSRRELKRALDELALLIQRVTEEKDFGAYFALPPNLEQCWKVMQCGKKDCPCYGRESMPCWEVAGTLCNGEAQGDFAKKYGDCRKCRFYQVSTSDLTLQIGIQFNHMMRILEGKNRQLEEAYAELKSTQSQILQQEKMASIGQLAAGVAHEINNPVGFVTSNLGTLGKYTDRLREFIAAQTEVAAACPDADGAAALAALRKKLKVDHVLQDAADLIRESLDGVERVKKIVQNLKNFSRVDQAERALCNINDCIEDTLNIVWNELKYKAKVNKDYADLPLTRCYPQQLNQVFMNLLVNAAQAIEKQGEISIKTWAAEGNIFITITDTGCGIPTGNLQRLFEPFFTTKEVGKGTGLGLSIVYDIVTKKHHGQIFVASEIGKGSTFTVRLPIVEED